MNHFYRYLTFVQEESHFLIRNDSKITSLKSRQERSFKSIIRSFCLWFKNYLYTKKFNAITKEQENISRKIMNKLTYFMEVLNIFCISLFFLVFLGLKYEIRVVFWVKLFLCAQWRGILCGICGHWRCTRAGAKLFAAILASQSERGLNESLQRITWLNRLDRVRKLLCAFNV